MNKIILAFAVAVCLSVAPAFAYVPNSASVALALPFNEGSGSIAYDHSGLGNDGVVYGSDWVSGVYDTALSFNAGLNVIIPDSPAMNATNLTVMAWVRTNAGGGVPFVIYGN